MNNGYSVRQGFAFSISRMLQFPGPTCTQLPGGAWFGSPYVIKVEEGPASGDQFTPGNKLAPNIPPKWVDKFLYFTMLKPQPSVPITLDTKCDAGKGKILEKIGAASICERCSWWRILAPGRRSIAWALKRGSGFQELNSRMIVASVKGCWPGSLRRPARCTRNRWRKCAVAGFRLPLPGIPTDRDPPAGDGPSQIGDSGERDWKLGALGKSSAAL